MIQRKVCAMTSKILMIGWDPSVVDYSKWPGLTPDKLRAGLTKDQQKVQKLGHVVQLDFVTDSATAPETLKARLRTEHFDVVVLGAGIR